MKTTVIPGIILVFFLLHSCSTSENTEHEKPAVKQSSTSENQIEYYENGVKKSEGMLVNGKKHGKWISFYPNSYKWSEVTYNNGAKTGPVMSFYENGMLRYQGTYTNDQRSGTWSFYDEEGKLIKTINTSEKNLPDSLK